MPGNLETALRTLIMESLTGLFGGTAPVQIAVVGGSFSVDSDSADATAGEPRPDDHADTFAFDPAHPTGPYTLSQTPYPGPRRVWLMTSAGDRVALRDAEILIDESDNRLFTLSLRPNRDLTGFSNLRVLYGVTAVFTKIKAVQTVTVQLKSTDAVRLQQSEALVIAVIQLNRQQLVERAAALYENDDYGAQVEVKSLTLLKGEQTASDTRLLTLQTDFELKASRALTDQEGHPIRHIHSPGRPINPNRPVDIEIDVEA